MYKKRFSVVLVVFLLVLSSLVMAENDDSWFSNFFGGIFDRENVVGSASCEGFWECYLGGENLVGGASDING